MRRPLPKIALAPLVALAALAGAAPRAEALPPVKHVVVIWLENKNYVETFGANSDAKYFSGPLAQSGQLLTQYYGTGHLSLDNYIAAVSGQPPNPVTQSDCATFQDFAGAVGPDGIAVGQGCVYPKAVQTIADQLEAKGLTWKGYMEDMGSPCRHPAVNAPDNTQQAKVGDQYATRHNPFMYFHSVIDEASCAANDVPLDRLPADLADPARTPSFAFITPNLCNDGHDAPCVDGRPGGLKSADAWLQAWIPRILAAPAIKQDGMVIVTFDEAEAGGPSPDASACCDEPPGPNTPNPGGPVPGPGGGRVGAVVLSRFVTPGSVNPVAYNHYSFLRTVEDLFGLPHLGYAGADGLKSFGDDVFGRPAGGPPPTATAPTGPARSCGTRRLPAARHGRYRRGTLIAAARIVRTRRRARLEIRMRAHGARLYVRAQRRGARRTRRVGPHALGRCVTVRVTLPRGHGRVRLAASVRSGTERRRTLRY